MQTVPTAFLRSLEGMRRLPDTYTSIIQGTLIHDARNEFASIAIQHGFDRILWIDSDMTFPPDLLERLSKHLDNGKFMVCGLYFKRVLPTGPVIYCRQERQTDPVLGEHIRPVPYTDYPRNQTFEIDACGFGAVMTDVALVRAVWDRYGPPFSPYLNIGEDLSFCWRVREMGQRIWCDSSISAGHIGTAIFDEGTWIAQQRAVPDKNDHQNGDTQNGNDIQNSGANTDGEDDHQSSDGIQNGTNQTNQSNHSEGT